jgi:hypothetical protein
MMEGYRGINRARDVRPHDVQGRLALALFYPHACRFRVYGFVDCTDGLRPIPLANLLATLSLYGQGIFQTRDLRPSYGTEMFLVAIEEQPRSLPCHRPGACEVDMM